MLEKEARLAAKAASNAAKEAVGGEKKVKEKKKKEEVEVEAAPFVNTTPKGEKKGAPIERPQNCRLLCTVARCEPAYV